MLQPNSAWYWVEIAQCYISCIPALPLTTMSNISHPEKKIQEGQQIPMERIASSSMSVLNDVYWSHSQALAV
jgi:hypothetical protein